MIDSDLVDEHEKKKSPLHRKKRGGDADPAAPVERRDEHARRRTKGLLYGVVRSHGGGVQRGYEEEGIGDVKLATVPAHRGGQTSW